MPHAHERASDPTTLLGAAFRVVNNQGPLALIALSVIGLLTWLYVTKLDAMGDTLRDHNATSSWYQRQSCISLAVLAGTPPSLCEPKPIQER